MKIVVLYVNGLGNGVVGKRELFMKQHWRKKGVGFEFTNIDWYDGKNLLVKMRQVETKLKSLAQKYDKVILLGSSAGGSLALNVFVQANLKNVCFVGARGRLRSGNIVWPDCRKLEWSAHLQTDRPAQAFYDSVVKCETESLPQLRSDQKARMLILKPLTDCVVPLHTMTVHGVTQRKILAFGHRWAGYTSVISCRDMVLRFATIAL